MSNAAVVFTGATTDSVRDYLQQIGRTPLLDAKEEVELAQAIEVGLFAEERLLKPDCPQEDVQDLRTLVRRGQLAFDRFVTANLRLVVSIARRYVGRGLPMMDLIQEGNLGLVRAIEKYDFTSGNKFSTYGIWWIRQAIARSIADSARLIRVPVHTVERMNKVDHIERDLGTELGRVPELTELADATNLTTAEIIQLKSHDHEVVSLATPIGDDDSVLGEIIEDGDAAEPFETVTTILRHEHLERLIATLPERDAAVLRLRFGLDGREPQTLEQVANVYGITRERIRQIETRSLAKLRRPELAEYL